MGNKQITINDLPKIWLKDELSLQKQKLKKVRKK